MREFYTLPSQKIIYNKRERNDLWEKATSHSPDIDFIAIKQQCPALEHQIQRSYSSGNNIQSAVFSECVYAQTFANIFSLNVFANCFIDGSDFIPHSVQNLLSSYRLVPRYVYSTRDKKRMLIQAGGCDGIDSALITVVDLSVYTIEFKEPGAKTSEPDLPKYKDDGLLVMTDEWLSRNSQFRLMINEAHGLNFFEIMGTNFHNFTIESIDYAVSNNYSSRKKFADVICTEDKNGYLTMLPTNQVSTWAKIEGEIRPAGRNHYKVWTPTALRKILNKLGAEISGDTVSIPRLNLTERRERGGNRRISGYKITPLFFIYRSDCEEHKDILIFDLDKIQQLNPTIAAKMFFRDLDYKCVKRYYGF